MPLMSVFSRLASRRAMALLGTVASGFAVLAPAAGAQAASLGVAAPNPDRRIGLKAGIWDAGQAEWNMHLLSTTRPSEKFLGQVNSDLAFSGPYAIQGSFAGYQVWDISNPARPALKTAFFCPASQSDVSVYKNLLFVSAEAETARLDCGGQGVEASVSSERIRGIRIFDITDIANPKYIANVQTCRGSHTHTVLADPKDPDNVYVYISGSAGPRDPKELAGCSNLSPSKDPNSPLFRIEVIKVPLAHPEKAAIVSSPRIFNDLTKPAIHGPTAADKAELDQARAQGRFVVDIEGETHVLSDRFVKPILDSVVKARGGSAPTAADSATLRRELPGIIKVMFGITDDDPNAGPTQCHDITVYPSIGYAGGACEGYGLLLDIHDPAHPVRIDAAADSNFSYWHSATFSNDGTKVLFSDEWGGGGAPKCRSTDPKEWGADAMFTIDASHKMHFQGYYKMPAAQTPQENCVAHNGSLIPIPGRDVMVQAWYQGGLSVFDWTDPKHATEIAYFDRGPIDGTRMSMAGSWSVYWYNGAIVSSEIARGLDVLELTPNPMLTANEIDAAKTVHMDYLNAQGQPKFVWPASFALSRAYTDQLERSHGLSANGLTAVRSALSEAELKSGVDRRESLNKLAGRLDGDARGSSDPAKVQLLAKSVRDLASASR
ncbi:MAG TPA: hypothetical protein VGQ44_10705 [Gemmatimonadaceae bacterium]|nr:hypothetical protein [Gemmatimonadaceae bacterium]